MEQGLQKANQNNRLAEWVQRVDACRRNGQKAGVGQFNAYSDGVAE